MLAAGVRGGPRRRRGPDPWRLGERRVHDHPAGRGLHRRRRAGERGGGDRPQLPGPAGRRDPLSVHRPRRRGGTRGGRCDRGPALLARLPPARWVAVNPRLPGLKLALFAVASVLVVVTIAATIRPFGSSGATRSYTAELTSASRLQVGDDVRVAGVKVGRVTKVSVTPDARARIGFDVADDLALTTASRLQVRYLNLVGDRYVALVDDGSSDTAQPTGTMLTTARTQPALDLNDLLGGFKPLFAALDPDQVNALALDIVKTLQGDGGTVRRLVARTAALTTGLAERDELIGSVVTNLDTTVGTVADRHRELEGLLAGLRSFVSGLAKDRK
ncbi:MAG: MCE family protein, partial [Actinomycetales bacterium]